MASNALPHIENRSLVAVSSGGEMVPASENPPPILMTKKVAAGFGGVYDSWPAHVSTPPRSKHIALTTSNRLAVIDDTASGKPGLVPKPLFLQRLETYLQRELKNLNAEDSRAGELRLQAYREVFTYLMEEFKTYKPLMFAIKNEYEMTISDLRSQIRQLEPLKQVLVSVADQCDKKIVAMREQEKVELQVLKKDNSLLKAQLSELRNREGDLLAQIDRLKVELGEQYQRYRDECDGRRLLVLDINELRSQLEEVQTRLKASALEEKEDATMLRVALQQARLAEAEATRKLSEMTADYADVVPKRDFEQLLAKHNLVSQRLDVLQVEFDRLSKEHAILVDTHNQVVVERDDLLVLRRTATPRPDWERCGPMVYGGQPRWKELTHGKRSAETLEVIIQELAGNPAANDSAPEYLPVKGNGLDVPEFLRCEGQVRNRRMNRRDCAIFVRDIWRDKIANENSQGDEEPRLSLQDYLTSYFKKAFGIEKMRFEWSYNLFDACQRHSSQDERVTMFLSILNGDTEEEVYYEQLRELARMHNHFVEVEKGALPDGGEGDLLGVLSRAQFEQALQNMYKHKDPEVIKHVAQVAYNELQIGEADTLEYRGLFMEDEEGRTGPFLDQVINILKKDRLDYLENIVNILTEKCAGRMVEVVDLSRAIGEADPSCTAPDSERYCAWVFRNKGQTQGEAPAQLELSVVTQRLRNMYVNVRRDE